MDSFLRKMRAVAAKRKAELGGERPGNKLPVDVLRAIGRGFFFITEIKRKSPSAGIIREDFDHINLARAYALAGASAVSVLTESVHFGGTPEYLQDVRKAVNLPLLRKDFILTTEQVRESYLLGADMVLLITACLETDELRMLHSEVVNLGMTPLVEVHNERELEEALKVNPAVLGINNRNLNDFSVSLETSLKLAELIPPNIRKISESGIWLPKHISTVREAGFDGVLVGESLLRHVNPGEALKRLRNG